MVDTEQRGMGAGEATPITNVLTTDRHNFNMGIGGARDYREMLATGVAKHGTGAPVPYAAGGPTDPYAEGTATAAVDPTLYGTNTLDTDVPIPAQQAVADSPVPGGMHQPPMAGYVNDGSVPAGTTGGTGYNVRPQGYGLDRENSFAAGESDSERSM